MLVLPCPAAGFNDERLCPLGRLLYDAGRYNRAVSLYETACRLDPQNANLPVRLAQAYINSGNYTKAEYTLVSAITNNPESVQLYVALSKAYIEQDKILDAEQMLDRITSSDVKAQIDALRPVRRFSPRKRLLQRVH